MTNSDSSSVPAREGEASLPRRWSKVRWWGRNLLTYGLLTSLLYFALRRAPISGIWESIKQLQIWQLLTLAGINIVIYVLITLRWWLVVRAERRRLPFLPFLAVRVAVFGISYFTLGPQIGGEPLQILYLQHKYGLTYTRAFSTVIMDKLLEFLANFVFLAIGLAAITQVGFLSTSPGGLWVKAIGLIVLTLWPPIHILFLYHGRYPLSALLGIFRGRKFVRFIGAAERLAGTFCRRHLSMLVLAILVSILGAAGMVTEFFCIISFLQIDLLFWQTVAAWTAGWLAFLAPLPGGLGALEASQVFVLGTFGIPAAAAISVTLLIRARDLLIGGLGLILAGRGIGK